MSDAATPAKESGFNAAVMRFPIVGAGIELVKRFGIVTAFAVFLVWRVDGWISETREDNKAMTKAMTQTMTQMAVDNAKIIQENTQQSKQTQAAIEKLTEESSNNRRALERTVDRLERTSSAIAPRGRAPVIE